MPSAPYDNSHVRCALPLRIAELLVYCPTTQNTEPELSKRQIWLQYASIPQNTVCHRLAWSALRVNISWKSTQSILFNYVFIRNVWPTRACNTNECSNTVQIDGSVGPTWLLLICWPTCSMIYWHLFRPAWTVNGVECTCQYLPFQVMLTRKKVLKICFYMHQNTDTV